LNRSDALRYAGAVSTLVVGAIHLQQYVVLIKDVPTIGELFLLNAAGAAVIAAMLATGARVLGAIGGILLSAGAIVSLVIARTSGGLFEYVEPTFRTPVLLSTIAEVAAVLALGTYLIARRKVSARETKGGREAAPLSPV
jgi:hypothetical protein